jgi:type IV pilus assembly protein PilW
MDVVRLGFAVSSVVARQVRPTRRIRGFTLIELMVAMAVAMLVLGGIAMVFAGTSRNRADIERSSRLAENAHFALELLSDELRVAGYFAEMSFVGVTWQSPDPCTTTLANLGWSSAPFTAPVSLTGYQAADATPVCVTHRKAGTPILVARRVAVDPTPPANATTDAYLQVSKCAADPKPWVVSNQPADFTLRNLDCATVADVRRLMVRLYYVATCDDCSVDAIPTLKRVDLIGGALIVTPLVEGVETLQLEYGFDADNDGFPDRFLSAPDATLGPAYAEWSNVMAARFYVLLRSSDAQPGYRDATKSFNLGLAGYTAPANDGYKRALMTSVVRLNNPAGQRETP